MGQEMYSFLSLRIGEYHNTAVKSTQKRLIICRIRNVANAHNQPEKFAVGDGARLLAFLFSCTVAFCGCDSWGNLFFLFLFLLFFLFQQSFARFGFSHNSSSTSFYFEFSYFTCRLKYTLKAQYV